jgi:hypothetical protein
VQRLYRHKPVVDPAMTELETTGITHSKNIMKQLLRTIPWLLQYSRLLVAVLLLMFSFMDLSPAAIVALCLYAMLSDVICGIMTRGESRRDKDLLQFDTKIDTIFWFSCLFYLCIYRHDFLKNHIAGFFVLVFSELFIILFGLLRFRERISYHTVLSRCWTVALLWCFIELVYGRSASLSFSVVLWCGVIVQLEILAIACILRQNVIHVPGIVRAIRYKKRSL